MAHFCTICLNSAPNMINVNQIDQNHISFIIKLRSCVPEVDWNLESNICFPCSDQLERVYAFRDLCIKSYLIRKETEKKFENSLIKIDEKLNNYDYLDDPSDDIDEKSETSREIKYNCYHCNKNYQHKSKLEEHMKRTHTKNRPRRKAKNCDSCGKLYLSDKALAKHKSLCSEATEAKPCNICDICGTSFTNKYLLKRHIVNVHATEKKFKCELCDSKFASPGYLNAHKRYHTGERKHICSFCGKGYITASDLYHHEKIHENKRAYQCQLCSKAFNTSSDLHKHKICVHLDRSQWKYECSFCQRRFPLKTNLDTHTKTHTGERNFLCHLCYRKCINQSVLKRHLESHSSVKSYKCKLCMQAYKYQKSLDIHMAKIHGIGDTKIPERVKKYFCSFCPKSYFANNKLQKHIRSHTGERPFKCPACDKCFIDKSYIKQHLKTSHNMISSV